MVVAGGAGAIQNLLQQARDLKDRVIAGKLTVTDYQKQLEKIVGDARETTEVMASSGAKNASAVNPIWQNFQNEGYVASQGGKWVTQLPFSREEWSRLPENVLPTRNDVQSGGFNPLTAPFERYQDNPDAISKDRYDYLQKRLAAGGNNGVADDASTIESLKAEAARYPGASQQAGGSQAGPTDQNNPGLPGYDNQLLPGIDLRTDQGQINFQGQQNAKQLQDILNKQYLINQKAIDQYSEGVKGIPDLYKTEGQNQYDQLTGLADQQKSARAQALTDLATTLSGRQMDLFNRAIPDLAEQANTRGIYRSTGFGDILANKYTQLTADTQNQLALQGISDRDAYLMAQQGALAAKLGYSGQATSALAGNMDTIAGAKSSALQSYGSGLGDVANAAIGMQNAGLQRQFSLSDFLAQKAAAGELADKASKTQPQTGKASPGTQAWLGPAYRIGGTAAGGMIAGPAGASAGGKAGSAASGGSATVPQGYMPPTNNPLSLY